MQMFDQLSRFKLDSNSVLKEIQSKLIGKVQRLEHFMQMLHIMTRIDVQHDQKLIGKLAKSVNDGLSKLSYTQIGLYLESLLLLDFKVTPEFSDKIVKELETRQ